MGIFVGCLCNIIILQLDVISVIWISHYGKSEVIQLSKIRAASHGHPYVSFFFFFFFFWGGGEGGL